MEGIKREDGFCWLEDVMNSLPEDSVFRRVISVGKGSYFTGYDDVRTAEPFLDHVHYPELADKMGEKLIIGRYVCIAPSVNIILGGNQNHPLTAVTQHPLFHLDKDGDWRNLQKRGNTVIGDDVWLGRGVTVMPGVKIGQGARILPGAVVVKDVEPYSINGGVPAKAIGRRFDSAEIKLLMDKIRWTEWPEEVISEHVNLLLAPKPDLKALVKIADKLEDEGLLPAKTRCGNQMLLTAFIKQKQNSL